MDRLEAMAILLTAVECGSLSAASRKLGKPLSTISRKISNLESQLNAQLLVRTSQKLELTEAGRNYFLACKQILAQVNEAEREVSGEYSTPKGNLVITAPIVFGRLYVLPIIVEFLKAYPDINIRLVQADRIVHLLNDHVDLAIRIGKLPDSSLVATHLGEVRLVVCASRQYLKENGIPFTPEQLVGHTCINFENMDAFDNWFFTKRGNAQSVELGSRLMVNTAEAAIDAAISGLGMTQILSYQIEAAYRDKLLDVILEEYEPNPLPVNMVFSRQGALPLKLRAFIDFAKPRIKDALNQRTL